MNYVGVHRKWLQSPPAIRATDQALGAWVRLQSYATDRQTGIPREGCNRESPLGESVILNCKSWQVRDWDRMVGTDESGIAAVVDAGLARWENDDLILEGYDLWGQISAEAKAKSLPARLPADPRLSHQSRTSRPPVPHPCPTGAPPVPHPCPTGPEGLGGERLGADRGGTARIGGGRPGSGRQGPDRILGVFEALGKEGSLSDADRKAIEGLDDARYAQLLSAARANHLLRPADWVRSVRWGLG